MMTLSRRDFIKTSSAATVAIGADAVFRVRKDFSVAQPIPAPEPRQKLFQWRLIEITRAGDRKVLYEQWAVADMAGSEIFATDRWPRTYLFVRPIAGRKHRTISGLALFDGDRQIVCIEFNYVIRYGDTLAVEVQEVFLE